MNESPRNEKKRGGEVAAYSPLLSNGDYHPFADATPTPSTTSATETSTTSKPTKKTEDWFLRAIPPASSVELL